MSDSVRPHRQQPTRPSHPWDSPGKNTGVGCHFLLQCMKVKSEIEDAQSCPTLSDPMDISLPGSSIHGIFQARVLEWVAIAFSILSYKILLFATRNLASQKTHCRMVFQVKFQIPDRISLDGSVMLPLTNLVSKYWCYLFFCSQ